MIEGEKILITGPTGQVAYAIAVELAKKNDVHALARFGKPGSRDRLERHGMQCIAGDFVSDDLGSLIDDDYDRVLHFAVNQQAGKADFEYAIEVNAVGTGKPDVSHPQDEVVPLLLDVLRLQAPGTHPPRRGRSSGRRPSRLAHLRPLEAGGRGRGQVPLATVRSPRNHREAERGLR